MESKHTVWFLGSNSEHGFHSLYDGFCAGDGDFLRVIKGGPGGEEQCVAGTRQGQIPDGMGPGEVYLFTPGGNSLYLQNIRLTFRLKRFLA